MIFAKLLCWKFGHRWRKLTKKERESPGCQVWASSRDSTVAQMRRCTRCNAERAVKPRKAKEKP